MKIRFNSIGLIVILLTAISCNNIYERKLTGEYKILSYHLVGDTPGMKPFTSLSPILKLKSDLTFEYSENMQIKGNWSAVNSDWYLITLDFTDGPVIDGFFNTTTAGADTSIIYLTEISDFFDFKSFKFDSLFFIKAKR
jgi:hypothetical protein